MGTSDPAGWIFSGIGTAFTTEFGKSAPGILLDNSGDQITSNTSKRDLPEGLYVLRIVNNAIVKNFKITIQN